MHISISYQDRLEDNKCFHLYVCMCVIRLDRYQERFRWMTHTSPGLMHSVAPLIRYTGQTHYIMHDALQKKGSTALSHIKIISLNLIYFLFLLVVQLGQCLRN